MTTWKSPRCSQACWDEIETHEQERMRLISALVKARLDYIDVCRDRDEWRTQHENLLVMYHTAIRGPYQFSSSAPRSEKP